MGKTVVDPLAAGRELGVGVKAACRRHRRTVLWRRGRWSVTALGAALVAGGAVLPGLAPGHSVRAGYGRTALSAAGRGLTAYVTSPSVSNVGYVTPVNTATNRPGKPIKMGDSPLVVAVTPDGKTVYAANALSNTVTPIATATNKPGAPIKAGKFPWRIAITPDGTTAYIASDDSGTVTPIATATNTAGKPIRVGSMPRWIVVTPDGRTAYVADWDSHTITPITTATNKPGPPIKLGRFLFPTDIAFAR